MPRQPLPIGPFQAAPHADVHRQAPTAVVLGRGVLPPPTRQQQQQYGGYGPSLAQQQFADAGGEL